MFNFGSYHSSITTLYEAQISLYQFSQKWLTDQKVSTEHETEVKFRSTTFISNFF